MLFYMVNRSSKCYNPNCGENSLTPVYFRDENRIYKVAFYICKSCMNFSEFIDWTTKPPRSIPFYNDMQGMVRVRLVKDLKDDEKDRYTRKNRVLQMQKDNDKPCIKCSKFEISKLYIRDRPTFIYVGYVCKNCKVIYLVNRQNFRLKTLDPKGYYKQDGSLPAFHDIPFEEYMSHFAVATGKPEKIDYGEIHLKLPSKQIEQIKKFMKKKNIPLTSRL